MMYVCIDIIYIDIFKLLKYIYTTKNIYFY